MKQVPQLFLLLCVRPHAIKVGLAEIISTLDVTCVGNKYQALPTFTILVFAFQRKGVWEPGPLK